MTVVLILCALYALDSLRTCSRCGRDLNSFFSPCPQCGKKAGERA